MSSMLVAPSHFQPSRRPLTLIIDFMAVCVALFFSKEQHSPVEPTYIITLTFRHRQDLSNFFPTTSQLSASPSCSTRSAPARFSKLITVLTRASRAVLVSPSPYNPHR
ncbi:hypothetical protein FRC16_005408 [Serendipita sp. 398]|nr:hypothetical protein FRC16_005408 [Serendipita sp. 398]